MLPARGTGTWTLAETKSNDGAGGGAIPIGTLRPARPGEDGASSVSERVVTRLPIRPHRVSPLSP